MQQLSNEIIGLESKKKRSIDELSHVSDTLNWYHGNIKLNKQILCEWDKQINQKLALTVTKNLNHAKN
jgi:uncharacterized membrane protein